MGALGRWLGDKLARRARFFVEKSVAARSVFDQRGVGWAVRWSGFGAARSDAVAAAGGGCFRFFEKKFARCGAFVAGRAFFVEAVFALPTEKHHRTLAQFLT